MAAPSKWTNGRVGTFQTAYSFAERTAEARRVLDKLPGRIPVVVERAASQSAVPSIDKNKFLVPGDLTVAQFVCVVRNRLALRPEMALFVFVGSTMPPSTTLMREVYHAHKNADGFLYMLYAGEATFGSCDLNCF